MICRIVCMSTIVYSTALTTVMFPLCRMVTSRMLGQQTLHPSLLPPPPKSNSVPQTDSDGLALRSSLPSSSANSPSVLYVTLPVMSMFHAQVILCSLPLLVLQQ
ncbi:UNVERIFIED_CONTAM: hypothetical protein K2H54_056878 [Gekko kuhli]